MNSLETQANIFGAIFTLSNKLQLLGDRMDPQLTVKQWLFLAGVLKGESPAPTLSEIASRIGSSRQNVKKMALILEKQGFVRLSKDASDSRALRVSLTEACLAHLKGREDAELDFIKAVFNGFENDELTTLAAAIKKLENNVYMMVKNNEDKEAE